MRRVIDWRHIAFFLVVPAIFASYAASGHRLNPLLPSWQVLGFCLAHALVAWWVACGVTRGVQEVLRPWRPHQVIILTLGVALTQWVYAPVTGLLDRGFLALLGERENILTIAASIHPEPAATPILTTSLRDYLIWIVVNLLFDRFLGLPRYRYGPAAGETDAATDTRNGAEATGAAHAALEAGSEKLPSAPGSPAAPADPSAAIAFSFLSRIDNPPEPDEVIALKAEQHYLKVITAEKSYILLYRFGDAVEALPDSIGLQVHRSWWIRKTALHCLHQRGRRMLAELHNGLRIPVSGPNQALLRRIAAENDTRIKPLKSEYSAA